MTQRKPIFDLLPKKDRQECIDEIIGYFQDSRGEKIGIIGAEQILEITLEKIIWAGYNKGIEDAKEKLSHKIEDLNIDLDLMKR